MFNGPTRLDDRCVVRGRAVDAVWVGLEVHGAARRGEQCVERRRIEQPAQPQQLAASASARLAPGRAVRRVAGRVVA